MALQAVTLTEYVSSSSRLAVDRENGVIRGVKILGLTSANGRRYSHAAVKGAVKHYEGRAVNVNHPAKPGEARSAYDRFGRTVGVEYREGEGLFGNLEYLKAHPLAGPLSEAAERMPGMFGLSHHAEGSQGRDATGPVVESIDKVHSVDVVADAATTRGLFEGRMTTAKSLLEAAYANDPAKLKIIREDMPMADAPAAAPADAGDNVKTAFKSMVMAVLDDDGLDLQAKVGKIKEILKAQEKLSAKADAPPPDKPADTTKESQQMTATLNALQERLAVYERKDRVRALAAETKATLTEAQVEALAMIPDGEKAKALIEGFAAVGKTADPPRSAGRTQPKTDGKPDLSQLKESKDWQRAVCSSN